MKSIKFIIGGTFLVFLIAFGFRNSENKLTKNDSLASIISMSKVEAEGFFDTWLWEEEGTSTSCEYSVTNTVYIWNGVGWILSTETLSYTGHMQNCIDGP